MASQIIQIPYATIDTFLRQSETPAQTMQRHQNERLQSSLGNAAQEARRIITINLTSQRSAKRIWDESQALAASISKRQRCDKRLDLRRQGIDNRPAGPPRTVRQYRIFHNQQNDFIENPDGSVSANPAAPARPTSYLEDPMSDKKEAMKVVFFAFHNDSAEIIYQMLESFPPVGSLERRVVITKLSAERSRLQSRFFDQARPIAESLTALPEFLEFHELESKKRDRATFFKNRVTQELLGKLYKHVASAVDIPKILKAATPDDKAFRKFMIQVFVQAMEDLWSYQLHPSKLNLPRNIDSENKKRLFASFRRYTDRHKGLHAARTMPDFQDIPISSVFPKRNAQQPSHHDSTDDDDIPRI